MTRALRWGGWLLIAAGAVVLLYLVYSLFFTNVVTNNAQADLQDRWEREVGPLDRPGGGDRPQADTRPDAVDPGSAVAVLRFHRPGAERPPVHADPLFIVSGTALSLLTRGPGHYEDTAMPGEDGNFAIAGHRTTYGAPFFHLDQVEEGDELLVTARSGTTYVYRVVEQRIVAPGDVGVIGPDPLGNGRPTMTITTCHPRFSNRQRLVVFGELMEEVAP